MPDNHQPFATAPIYSARRDVAERRHQNGIEWTNWIAASAAARRAPPGSDGQPAPLPVPPPAVARLLQNLAANLAPPASASVFPVPSTGYGRRRIKLPW